MFAALAASAGASVTAAAAPFAAAETIVGDILAADCGLGNAAVVAAFGSKGACVGPSFVGASPRPSQCEDVGKGFQGRFQIERAFFFEVGFDFLRLGFLRFLHFGLLKQNCAVAVVVMFVAVHVHLVLLRRGRS